MPKGYPNLTEDQKKEIISRIKEKGERVADLAKEYCSGTNILDTGTSEGKIVKEAVILSQLLTQHS